MAVVLLPMVSMSHAVSMQPSGCADIHDLVEQSTSGFAAIRGKEDSDLGGYEATLVLPGAWSCAVLEDVEKWSYRCVWKYPLGNVLAHEDFQRLLEEVRHCIGATAEERADQSVNHPDFYASSHFQLPDSAVSVSLKNKAKLKSTFVSIRIDGRAKTE